VLYTILLLAAVALPHSVDVDDSTNNFNENIQKELSTNEIDNCVKDFIHILIQSQKTKDSVKLRDICYLKLKEIILNTKQNTLFKLLQNLYEDIQGNL